MVASLRRLPTLWEVSPVVGGRLGSDSNPLKARGARMGGRSTDPASSASWDQNLSTVGGVSDMAVL